MPSYAAFLRAINVGKRKATGEQLRNAASAAGFEDVASFRNSGNLVFRAGAGDAKARKALEGALESELGFVVKALLRSSAKIRAIAASEPFTPKQLAASKGKIQVVLLERAPSASASEVILERSTPVDLLVLEGSELYWLPKGGISDSKPGMKGIDKLVGLNTVRAIGTIEQMNARFFRD